MGIVNVAMMCATMVKIPIVVLSIALVGIISASLNLTSTYLLVNMILVVIEIINVKNMKILNTVQRIVRILVRIFQVQLLRNFQLNLLTLKWGYKFRIICRCARMIILFRNFFNYACCRYFIFYGKSLILNIF